VLASSYRSASGHISFFLGEEVKHSLLYRLVQQRGRQRAEDKSKLA